MEETRNVTVLEKEVLSSDGIHTLKGYVYLPDGPIRGCFHAVHGMTEHIARYDVLLRLMAERGFVAFGYDHLGHGRTAVDPSELGYIAPKDGWKYLVADVGRFSDAVREEYGKQLPYVLMGHSMGSFIVRLAAADVVKPDGLIVMGTGGPNPASGLGICLIKILKKTAGERAKSDLIDKLAFGAYNDRFKDENARYSWLMKDPAVRAAYENDPFCAYRFTNSGMEDLLHLQRNCNLPDWFRRLPADVPVSLVSGEEDPVGDYGKGVRAVEKGLRESGHQVECHLYPTCRHEVLNDTCREELLGDITAFADRVASK